MGSRDPAFSVVVPTHGRPALLDEAVRSALAQTVADLEVVVVDDASPEPPELPDDPRVRLVRLPTNRGPAAARNAGIDAARGRTIAFLDDDDVFTPDRLALAAEGLRHAPVATCFVRFLHEATGQGGGPLLRGWVHDTILDAHIPPFGATAFRRDLDVRLDESLDNMEDLEWWLRASRTAPVWTVPSVGLLYRRHDATRRRTGPSARLAASVRFLDEHRDWFDAHPKAAAFRWKQVGLLARREGDATLARRAFARSLRLQPSPRAVAHLARALC